MDKAAIERVEQRKHAKITVRHLGQNQEDTGGLIDSHWREKKTTQ
jgi:hypothetical protein